MAAARTIIVAGAGIGGLTAALSLAAKGFRVIVLEKAERLEEAGAGLQLSPNASRILVDLGLRPRLVPRAVTPEAINIMSARAGGEIARLPLGEAASLRAGAPYWVMHRADLQGALQAEVNDHPDIDLRLGCQFEDVTSHAKGLTVVQRRGNARQQELAVALIGADGIWSAVRNHLFPEVQPQFSGLIAWRGTLDATTLPREYTSPRVQLWMGPDAHLVAYPISARAADQRGRDRAGNLEQAGLERPRRCQRTQERVRLAALARDCADADRRRRRVAAMGAVHAARSRRMDGRRDRAARRRRARDAAVCRARRGHGDRGRRRARQSLKRKPGRHRSRASRQP